MNRWQGCWLPFVKQRRGGVAGLGDRRGMTTEKKSISTISLSLRWCVVAAAAAARRGNQVFVHLARVFLGAIYSCRRKAAATPQLPLILVWVVYLYVCVCAGRPADLICFFPLLGTFEIHPTASSCIYIHPSGGSSASLLLSKGFSLPSRQYRSQYTPARRSHWGWVFYRGFFFLETRRSICRWWHCPHSAIWTRKGPDFEEWPRSSRDAAAAQVTLFSLIFSQRRAFQGFFWWC